MSSIRFFTACTLVVSAICLGVAWGELPNPTEFTDADLGKYYELEFSRKLLNEIRHLPSEKRAAWITRVQRFYGEHPLWYENSSEKPFDFILFAAGEPAIREDFATRIGKGAEPKRVVTDTGDPGFAAMIGDLVLGEKKDPNSGDVQGRYATASNAWEIIRLSLRLAPEFSDSVKQWARAVPGRGFGEGEDLEIEREWWRANRDAMRAGRYSEVQPGRLLPKWLEGLPAMDPPFEPGQPSELIEFGRSGDFLRAMYADYLEQKRGGENAAAKRMLDGNTPTSGESVPSTRFESRRYLFSAIILALGAVVAPILFWMSRRRRRK